MKYIPNILTLFRIFLIGVYLSVYYSNMEYALQISIGIFLLAGVTDVLDGYIARKFNVVTRFGQVADPFADKAMQLTTLLTLSYSGYIDRWIVYIIVAKESFLIISGIILYVSKTKIVIPSNIYGKLTTVFIYVAIILSVTKFMYLNYVFMLVIGFAGATLLQYIMIGVKKLKHYFEQSETHEEINKISHQEIKEY